MYKIVYAQSCSCVWGTLLVMYMYNHAHVVLSFAADLNIDVICLILQKDMPYFRKRMVLELLTKEFMT